MIKFQNTCSSWDTQIFYKIDCLRAANIKKNTIRKKLNTPVQQITITYFNQLPKF